MIITIYRTGVRSESGDNDAENTPRVQKPHFAPLSGPRGIRVLRRVIRFGTFTYRTCTTYSHVNYNNIIYRAACSRVTGAPLQRIVSRARVHKYCSTRGRTRVENKRARCDDDSFRSVINGGGGASRTRGGRGVFLWCFAARAGSRRHDDTTTICM